MVHMINADVDAHDCWWLRVIDDDLRWVLMIYADRCWSMMIEGDWWLWMMVDDGWRCWCLLLMIEDDWWWLMMGVGEDDADKEHNDGSDDDVWCMMYDGWRVMYDGRRMMHDDGWWMMYDGWVYDDDDGIWVDIVPKTWLLTMSMTLCRLLMKACEFPEAWAIGPITGTFWYHVSLFGITRNSLVMCIKYVDFFKY